MDIFLLIVATVVVVTIVLALRAGAAISHTTTALDPDVDTVTLTGEIVMTHYDGLHHAVNGHITAKSGRKVLATTTVNEDNEFTMQIPADVVGEVEVALGLHGGSVALVNADGEDLHAVLIYNPVNNFFA